MAKLLQNIVFAKLFESFPFFFFKKPTKRLFDTQL